MQLILELPVDLVARLMAAAQQQGQETEEYIRTILESQASAVSSLDAPHKAAQKIALLVHDWDMYRTDDECPLGSLFDKINHCLEEKPSPEEKALVSLLEKQLQRAGYHVSIPRWGWPMEEHNEEIRSADAVIALLLSRTALESHLMQLDVFAAHQERMRQGKPRMVLVCSQSGYPEFAGWTDATIVGWHKKKQPQETVKQIMKALQRL